MHLHARPRRPDRARGARELRAAAALALLATLAGCGGNDVELVEGVTAEIQAVDNAFRPQRLTVRAGTEVVWRNAGRNDHNVVPVDEDDEFLAEVDDFTPGDTYTYRFTAPGEYRYYCSLHGTADAGMIGTVVVEG